MTAPTTPADRAALAARLREVVGLLALPGEAAERDLLAAAAELERPRPRVEWRRHATHEDEVRAVIASRFGDFPLSLWWTATNARSERDRLLDAGFDVAPLPEVPRG